MTLSACKIVSSQRLKIQPRWQKRAIGHGPMFTTSDDTSAHKKCLHRFCIYSFVGRSIASPITRLMPSRCRTAFADSQAARSRLGGAERDLAMPARTQAAIMRSIAVGVASCMDSNTDRLSRISCLESGCLKSVVTGCLDRLSRLSCATIILGHG